MPRILSSWNMRTACRSRTVAWGRLPLVLFPNRLASPPWISRIEMTTPYLSQVQSSNAAAHILRSMEQAVPVRKFPALLPTPGTNLLGIISSDVYVVGLAGLLKLHWMLPGYQQDFGAPGGALVFELRQVRSTGEYIVRAYYTAQTLDQLRNLTPLTGRSRRRRCNY